MNLSRKLAELRGLCGLNQQAVCVKMTEKGLPLKVYTLSRWETGHLLPDMKQFLALCEIYRVDDVMQTFTGVQAVRESLLAGLNYTGQLHARKYIDFLRGEAMFTDTLNHETAKRVLPLYELPVSAGTGEFLDSDAFAEMDVDDTVPEDAAFAVRISGDSMLPRFVDGQIIFIKPQEFLELGEIGIFSLNGDAYCKKYGGNALLSLNRAYEPIVLREWDELRIFGKVLG
jgi:SOS-response transcriptional repressor LexA